MLRVDQAWGLFQASVAAHDNHAGYYAAGLATETTGHPDDKWGWAVQLALSIKNIPTGAGDTINIQGVYTDGATRYNFQDLAGGQLLDVRRHRRARRVPEHRLRQRSGHRVRRPAASSQRLKTWGFRGAYTHNWDPYWNTAIYGAYARRPLRHARQEHHLRARWRSRWRASPTGVTGCNPDFNIGQVGVITRWTPVKNLTFSADVTWTPPRPEVRWCADARCSSTSASAKPAAVYELKDQDTPATCCSALSATGNPVDLILI